MGHPYQAIGFNRQKRLYDLTLLVGVLGYLAIFMGVGAQLAPQATPETLLIRALATAAFGLLHLILAIGPLSRISSRFLPLLYNRRHLGVVMALLATGHALISLIQFHGFGTLHPLASVLVSDGSFESLNDLPFQAFGLLAWFIILIMAVTSHDFWLKQLSAPTWKRLHMLVYVAYVALLAHVGFGAGIEADSSAPIILTAAGAILLVGLHLIAAFSSRPRESTSDDGWVDAGEAGDIPDQHAKEVIVGGESVAVFRDKDRVFALSGVCQHQNGPLAEGRLVNGRVVCPWHGYEYCPLSGESPDPFEEWVPTFDVECRDGRIFVAQTPNAQGTEAKEGHIWGESNAGAPSHNAHTEE